MFQHIQCVQMRWKILNSGFYAVLNFVNNLSSQWFFHQRICQIFAENMIFCEKDNSLSFFNKFDNALNNLVTCRDSTTFIGDVCREFYCRLPYQIVWLLETSCEYCGLTSFSIVFLHLIKLIPHWIWHVEFGTSFKSWKFFNGVLRLSDIQINLLSLTIVSVPKCHQRLTFIAVH